MMEFESLLADVYTKEYLTEFMMDFVEMHWPKNEAAAHGGEPTPGRGEAIATLAMFLAELPEE